MDITRQGGQVVNVRHMLFAVQHRLIQVGDGPALGNIEAQQLSQLGSGGTGHGVAPGAEFTDLLAILVKGQVAVHHRRHAEGSDLGQFHIVLGLHVRRHVGISVLNAGPHIVQVVGPHAVLQAVLPGVIAGSDGGVVFADQHSLDAGGAQLNAQHGLARTDEVGNCFDIHISFLLMESELDFFCHYSMFAFGCP